MLVLASMCAMSLPADAQSLFQNLFGWGGSTAEPARSSSGPVPSLRSFQRSSPYGGDNGRPGLYQSQPETSSETGAYKTLCVRTCDGYYWPISTGAPRSRFYRDSKACEASCDGEAKLYYLPRGSSDIENMTDMSGRAYGELPMAFAYRKKLIAGCSCRPMPWTTSERTRHAQYAIVEMLERQQAEEVKVAVAAPAEPASAATDAPAAQAPASDGPPLDPELMPERTSNADATAAIRVASGLPLDEPPRVAGPLPVTSVAVASLAPDAAAAVSPVPAASASTMAAPPVTTEQHALPAVPAVTAEATFEATAGATAMAEAGAQIGAEAGAEMVPLKRRTKTASLRKKAARTGGSTTISWSGGGNYTWPGDSPRRTR